MTSYETCNVCHGREAFGDGPCDKCRHKPASIVETKTINGVQYYALKQVSTKQEKEIPYWTEIIK